MSELKSKCCLAPLVVEGEVTRFWRCTNCNRPSDPDVDQKQPRRTLKRD